LSEEFSSLFIQDDINLCLTWSFSSGEQLLLLMRFIIIFVHLCQKKYFLSFSFSVDWLNNKGLFPSINFNKEYHKYRMEGPAFVFSNMLEARLLPIL
jgi:hypothetical protein